MSCLQRFVLVLLVRDTAVLALQVSQLLVSSGGCACHQTGECF
jgi:hypothetical protein